MKNKINVVFSSHLGEVLNAEFIKHVNNTIGCNHEVYCVENYNEFSLPEIYNRSLFNYASDDSIMVFCHPDIIFKTNNWGKMLLNHFNNTQFGIIGVAGTTYLSETGRWWQDMTKIIGIVEHTDGKKTWVSKYSNPFNGVREVVTVDGLFIAVDPNRLMHQFNENYGKFHFYDVSFCLPNYTDGVDIGVITNIRILHKSVGMTNDEWEENRIKFVEEYKEQLPISVTPPYKEIQSKLKTTPKVSVIIPTKNNFQCLIDNLMSWNNVVKYNNYEILIADTGSNPDVIKQYDEITNSKIRLIKYDYFNFAKINNDVVKNHVSEDTELILFCNDDIMLLNDALTRCVEIYEQNKKNCGTIGIRLHYGDGSIQHCGISIVRDQNNNIHLTHKSLRKISDYPTNVVYDSIGNTGAFLLMNKNLFLEFGGFNEKYIECLEDVELNMQCLLNRKKNITVCDAVAFHFESISRNKDAEKNNRTSKDYFDNLHPFYLKNRLQLNKFFKPIIQKEQ